MNAETGYADALLLGVLNAHLTPLQREVFIDVAILHRPIRTVAAELGVTTQNISNHCVIARRKLASLYRQAA